MAQEETRKKKTGMARCLELASQHKGLVFISGILAAAAAVCSFLPYLSIYFIMRELIGVFPDMANANMSVVLRYGWMALGDCRKCKPLFLRVDVFPSGGFRNAL